VITVSLVVVRRGLPTPARPADRPVDDPSHESMLCFASFFRPTKTLNPHADSGLPPWSVPYAAQTAPHHLPQHPTIDRGGMSECPNSQDVSPLRIGEVLIELFSGVASNLSLMPDLSVGSQPRTEL
jgi:hypothetical protein